LGFLLSKVVSYGGDSPCSTSSPEENDPVVDFEVPDPKTYGPVAYEPKLCGPVTCEPVITEAGGPKLYVTIFYCRLTLICGEDFSPFSVPLEFLKSLSSSNLTSLLKTIFLKEGSYIQKPFEV
jgi:hypothetical protein